MKIYCLLLIYRSSIGILCSFSWYTFCHKIYHFKIFLIFNMHFYKKKLKKNHILFSIILKQHAFILLTINLEPHSLWWNDKKKNLTWSTTSISQNQNTKFLNQPFWQKNNKISEITLAQCTIATVMQIK